MPVDYNKIGFNEKLEKIGSLSDKKRTTTSSYSFDTYNEGGVVNRSQIFANAVGSAEIASVAVGSAHIGTAVIQNVHMGTAVIGDANIGTLSAGAITAGTFSTLMFLGGDNIRIDGSADQILVHDGTHNRVVMGFHENGFGAGKDWGFKVSRVGYDVLSVGDDFLIMSSKFGNSRQNNISFGVRNFTNSETFEDLLDVQCEVDFDDYVDSSVFLEVTGKVGGGFGYYRLYNITDTELVADSEANTTSTISTVFRSAAFVKPAGSKRLNVQYSVSDDAHFTDLYSCRIVMRYIE